MKKKTNKLFIFIGIAVAIVLVMFFLSTPPPPPMADLNKSGPVNDFRTLCDSMKASPWNSSIFSDLQSKLAALKSQEVISTIDALALEEYLNLAYAQRLQSTCADWKNSDGNSADASLLEAMEKISANANCAAFVSEEIELMRAYFKAISIPGKVQSFLNQEFTSSTQDQLIGEINKYCKRSGISHFNRLAGIASKQLGELSSFKDFADTYKGRMEVYKSYSNEADAKSSIQAMCPNENSNTRKYAFYLHDIESTPGLCN